MALGCLLVEYETSGKPFHFHLCILLYSFTLIFTDDNDNNDDRTHRDASVYRATQRNRLQHNQQQTNTLNEISVAQALL